MRPHRLVGLVLLFATLGEAGGSAFGGDSAAETALKAKGLTRSGRVFVDAEAEKPVLDKMKEVRATSFAAFARAAEKQAAAEQLQMQSAELEQQRATLQANLNALNQQINAQSSQMGGRYARAARSMGPSALQIEHQQVQTALNQTNTLQKTTKSQIPSAKDKATIDEDVKRKGDAFKTDLTDLRKLVDDATKKYDELKADVKVKKALEELEKAGHATMKIGPSEAFANGMKEIDQAERLFLGKKPATAAKKKTAAKKAKK
jgi:hypothetical protein